MDSFFSSPDLYDDLAQRKNLLWDRPQNMRKDLRTKTEIET